MTLPRLSRCGLVTLALLAMACGGGDGDGPTEPVDYFATDYVLVSVNGQPVPEPIDYVGSGFRITEITSGEASFSDGQRFTIDMATRVSVNGGPTQAGGAGATGTYVRTGNTLAIEFQVLGPSTATLSAPQGERTVTVNMAGTYGVLVFRETP